MHVWDVSPTWHRMPFCRRRPASMRPTRRCSSTVSRTFPVVNNTTSGLQPWQLRAEATSAQRSQWSLLGKVGPPGGPVVQEKGKGSAVKVTMERALKDDYETATWSPAHTSLSSLSLCLRSPLLIDSRSIDRVAAMLHEMLLLIMWWWTRPTQ